MTRTPEDDAWITQKAAEEDGADVSAGSRTSDALAPDLDEEAMAELAAEAAHWKAEAERLCEIELRCAVCGEFMERGPSDKTVIHLQPCLHAALGREEKP